MFVSVLGELFSKGTWIHQSTHMIWPLVFQKQKWWVAASHPTHSSRKCDIRWQQRFSIRWCCFLACCRPDIKVQNSHPFSLYLKASFSAVSYLFPCFTIQCKMMLKVAGDVPTIWLRDRKIQEISEPRPEHKYSSLMQKVMESSACLQYQAGQSTSHPLACNSIPMLLIFRCEWHFFPRTPRVWHMLSSTSMDATKLS